MSIANVGSRWSGGDLIFYEGNVSMGSIANILTLGDDAVTVGSATNDIDLKIFLGSATEFVLFDVGNSRVDFGADDQGVDVRLFGDTPGSYMMWDQSADKLIINAGTADLGTSCEADAYTVGGGAGVDFSGTITTLTVTKGIVTAAA